MTAEAADHWQRIYADNRPDEISWHEARPQPSIELIQASGLPSDAGIIDIGGGSSSLAGHLHEAGYSDLAVADVAASALEKAKAWLGEASREIDWIVADVRYHDFGRRYDLWHDRAVFHFMDDPDDRAAYVDALLRTLRPGGHVVIATFGPQGPEQCSGLPVARYDGDTLQRALGEELVLVSAGLHVHHTPSGVGQQFVYAHLRRRPGRARAGL